MPVIDLGGIHALGVGVAAVLLDLVLDALLDLGRTGAKGVTAIDHIDQEAEAVDLVADRQLQRGVVALFFEQGIVQRLFMENFFGNEGGLMRRGRHGLLGIAMRLRDPRPH